MKKNAKYITIIVTLWIIVTSSTTIYINQNNNDEDLKTYNVLNYRSKGYWDLTGSRIVIDDTDPTKSWAYTASHYDWCSGSGTFRDPYLLENITIDCLGSGTCIIIRNSNKYFIINNCTLYNAKHAIFLKNVLKGTLSNNWILDIKGQFPSGVRMMNCFNNTVQGNLIIDFPEPVDRYSIPIGVQMGTCHNNRLYNNTLKNFEGWGFVMFYCEDNVLKRNFLERVVIQAIDSRWGKRNVFLENTVMGGSAAFYNAYCHHSKILNNTMTSMWNGITLSDSNNITVSNNKISNTYHGIRISGHDNIINKNTINHSTENGILADQWSSNNLMHSNIFIDNNPNAFDSGVNNQWNTTYIGNYWDDYEGLDANGDGIGDTPYLISGTANSQDHYPIFDLDLIDTTPPVITIDYQDGDGTDGNPGKWNVLAYDDESGINEETIVVMIDGEFTGNIFGDYDVPNTLGVHTISVEVENNGGYLGSESDSVTIIDDDTTYPDINHYYTGDGTDGNPGEIVVDASDDSGLSIDPSGAYSVPNSLGTHIFEFTATDNDTDRVDDALTMTVHIEKTIIDDDVTPPEIFINYTGSGLDGDPGYFEWNVFDLDSGINEINITISYESTEGLDDYVINLEGTETGTWNLPPNLGIYTIEISARDNDDDRSLIIDSLTTELTRDQDILDDDVVSPELSNLIIIPSIFEINVTFNAIDESGIGNISTFINGELIEPITQIQFGSTYSFIFENQWLFQSGTSEVVIHVDDGDNDRPNDALTSSITGTFENVLYPTWEYIIWQLEELKYYIDENLCHRVVRSINRKLTQAQDHLYEAFDYFEEGSITCALFHDYLAKLFIRLAEHRTEMFNRKGLIEDYHADYIIDSLHEIRNNIVLLMGASTGEEQAYEIALIEVELLNLKDFIEDEIPCYVGRCLSAKISGSAKLLELALFKISMGYSIDCILECTQCKLEHTITKINFLLEKCKIPEDIANYLIEKISSIIGDIEKI